MFKKIFFLVLFSNYLFAKLYYYPCEPSIQANLPILENKIKEKSKSVQNKAKELEKKYKDYESKLKEYNEALTSYSILQDEKNKLLLDTKNQLDAIKKIYFFEVE